MEGSYLWYSITKRRGHTKLNACLNQYLYNWILHHTQAVQCQISNILLKVYIDDKTKNILSPRCYLRCLSDKLTTVWWVHQRRAVWRRQYINKIISSSVICHCALFFHPNRRRCKYVTRLCVGVSVVYMNKVWIILS